MGKLTALRVKSLVEPGRYPDGEGLILQVRENGRRSWLLRIQSGGKRRDIGLGDARIVSLAAARAAAAEVRRQVKSGMDPVAEKQKAVVLVPTFREAAEAVHKELLKGWRNGKHTHQWLTTLELYAFPKLGNVRVDQIEGPAIRDLLADIWLDKPETARRVKQRIGTILDWSYARGLRTSEAPMRSIKKGLPRQPRQNAHFAAMPYRDIPAFFVKLRERRSIGRLALQGLILTAARSGEVRGARINELDADLTSWTVPAERMKAGATHVVPLSPQASSVFLEALELHVAASDLIFQGQAPLRPLSDMTLLKILRDLELPYTVHGFRSSFRDWIADRTNYPREVAEAALAHTVENKVEAAYRRTDFSEKRRGLMEEWGAFCHSLIG